MQQVAKSSIQSQVLKSALYEKFEMKYRGSPLSTNSLSTIPEVVRFINSTKSANSPK